MTRKLIRTGPRGSWRELYHDEGILSRPDCGSNQEKGSPRKCQESRKSHGGYQRQAAYRYVSIDVLTQTLTEKDNHYLTKSAGYDPDRPWDKEEALFAEAKRDMDRLKQEDRGEVIGEADEGSQVGDVTMDFGDPRSDGDEAGGDGEEAEVEGQSEDADPGAEAGAEGEEGEAVEGEEVDGEPAAEDEGQSGEAGPEGLFLPGHASP
jgi:hypothetical protein